MNIVEILRDRIALLPAGEYTPGLTAVHQHVQVAARHLQRGQQSGDDTAFTDTIYRTNQAFEGSLKEAYRVLAEKDPARATPHEIERYLDENSVLRRRVIDQVVNYRKEWRNPSTHDYRLDFNEDEALLAILSVTGFAIVLVDQIAEFINRKTGADSVRGSDAGDSSETVDMETIALALAEFRITPEMRSSDEPIRQLELNGFVSGYLAARFPGLKQNTEWPIGKDGSLFADIFISGRGVELIIEVKRRIPIQSGLPVVFAQISAYMQASGARQALVYSYLDCQEGRSSPSILNLADGMGRVGFVGLPKDSKFQFEALSSVLREQ